MVLQATASKIIVLCNNKRCIASILARSSFGNILAGSSLAPAQNIYPGPRPPTAACTTPTKDIHILRARSNRTRNTLNREIGDGNASARNTGRVSILVILFDDDAVFRYGGELDVFIRDAFDAAGSIVDCFDADAWGEGLFVSCVIQCVNKGCWRGGL